MGVSAERHPWVCNGCPARSNSVVCRASESDPASFCRLVHRFFYQPRQVVFYEGHPCLGVYVLCSGKVKLTVSSPSGHRKIVNLVGPSGLIECAGFSEGAAHEATCETLEPSQVCLIGREGYLELLEKTPALAIELLQQISRRTMPVKQAGDRFPYRKTAGRLAALLLDLGRRFGRREPAGITIGIHLTREELAELVGAAPETVIRLLSRFKRERLVATKGSEITLLKPERLAKVAGSPP